MVVWYHKVMDNVNLNKWILVVFFEKKEDIADGS